jgi:glycosyltransferase involved in cell wall biosynthesis
MSASVAARHDGGAVRIAQIAPIIERVPPTKYGGTERVVSALTEELVRRGHEVTLFATGDSITSATLASIYPRALREAKLKDVYGSNVWSLFNIGKAYERQDEFDIIHDHSGFISLPTANLATPPVIMTCHGPFTPENRHIYRELRRPYLVTISNAQATVPGLHYAGTVYNGLDLEPYPFSEENDGYLLFVGRISPEKGLHIAIQIALNVNMPLIIAAKLDESDRAYFTQYVEPFLSKKITWIGEVDEEERNQLMSRAFCMIHAATWREPFGLTLIEAMACGCPVLGTNMGSIPELIAHGTSGFVLDTVEEMIDAVFEVEKLSRRACRAHVLERFTTKQMTDGYEELYRMALAERGL